MKEENKNPDGAQRPKYEDMMKDVPFDPVEFMMTLEWALDIYGVESRKQLAMEECGELITALAREKRGRATEEDILSEMADVEIMVTQLSYHYGIDKFRAMLAKKERRLAERLLKDDPKAKEIANTLEGLLAKEGVKPFKFNNNKK